MGRRASAVAAALAAVVTLTAAPLAAKPAWDRVANVKAATDQLVKRHRASGSTGVLKFLDACYRTHTIAEKFTQALEGCLVQDYIHSRALVAIYSRLPEQALAERKLPAPQQIAGAMNGRFDAIFAQYKISAAEVEALKAAVEQHGVPVFMQTMFATANPPAAAGASGGAAPAAGGGKGR